MPTDMILHPGLVSTLKRLTGNELDVARLMQGGELSSPQHLGTLALFDLRITGTGLAYRQGLQEFAWRNSDLYLNSEFLARCAGLPVLWEHPKGSTMIGDDFAERAIGSVFLPYIKDDEVWAISRIYDQRAAKLMEEGKLSTSPAVVFKDPSVNDRLESEDGRTLLFEGEPSLLDHLAICERGVWDKGGAPSGVRSDSEEKIMTKRADGTDEPEDKAGGDKMDKVLEFLSGLSEGQKAMGARLDALEAKKADEGKKKDEGEATVPKERPSERADSAMQRRASDAELAKIQARADSAFNEHGKRAPMPLHGETPLHYRVRMAGELKRYSPALEKVNLLAIADNDEAGFAHMENQIYADSEKEAARPTMFPDFEIRCRERRNPDTGSPIREFFGRNTYIREMSLVPRPVTALNTPGVLTH